MDVVDYVWKLILNEQPVCTGLAEIGHSKNSRHYGLRGDIRCRAADFRTRYLSDEQKSKIDTELRKRLCSPYEYDIVWESTHLHIEVDRK